MQTEHTQSRGPEWFISVGGCFFILVLGVSAFWEADIRWLHFFQAWMYIVAIALGLRRNRWGYFIGISAAGLWDYANIVATTFFLNGLQQLSQWIHTGHLERPDLLIAVPAWFSNLAVVIGCLWGYSRLPGKSLSDAADVCAYDRIFRPGHVSLPAALPRPLSANVASSLALNRLTRAAHCIAA